VSIPSRHSFTAQPPFSRLSVFAKVSMILDMLCQEGYETPYDDTGDAGRLEALEAIHLDLERRIRALKRLSRETRRA
jgi:hypothetical protein